MKGLPKELNTKQDYLNACDYAAKTNSGKSEIKERLLSLKNSVTIKTLKKSSAGKTAEEQTGDDYEESNDPGCKKIRLGFSESELNELIRRMS